MDYVEQFQWISEAEKKNLLHFQIDWIFLQSQVVFI